MNDKSQIKRLYSMAGALGLVESGNKDDPFHQLVYGITNKSSVKELTAKESKDVESELRNRMNAGDSKIQKKKKTKATQPGMMNAGQISKAWAIMYELNNISPAANDASVSDRMYGAIKKILAITPNMKEPFRWVSFEDGNKLIETLKKYVANAKKKGAS
ncbi:MAG: DUF1018 domain-containing protein [Oscillospiraceae bacterium]|nr:DUF1018 domain-containing protein [Oscillospiraceae bacterium]